MAKKTKTFQDRTPSVKSAENKIYKKTSKGRLMEILADGFSIKKLKINFISFDETKPEGSRITDSIVFWLSFEDALILSNDVLSGRYAKIFAADAEQAKKDKTEGKPHNACVPFLRLGGTNATILRERGTPRADGKCVSRTLKLTKGKHYLITAASGPGKVTDNGLISPDGKPEKQIMIGMTSDEIKEMALMIKMHLYAYTAAAYMRAAEVTKEIERAQLEGETETYAVIDTEKKEMQRQTKELVEAGIIPDLASVNMNEEITEDMLPF
jgi:hypothetical protein